MKPKNSFTRRRKYKLDEDCYDASSFEENYDNDNVVTEEDKDDEDYLDDADDVSSSIEVVVENINSGPKKRGPKPAKSQFYVEPKEFDNCISQYYKTGIITDDLALMINKIANKLSYAPNFINYSYRDEMVGDAVVRMMKALIAKKYDLTKGKSASAGPFSYFTKIAFNAFRNRIKKEKHAHNTLQEYQEEIIMNSEQLNFIKNKKSLNNNEDSLFIEE